MGHAHEKGGYRYSEHALGLVKIKDHQQKEKKYDGFLNSYDESSLFFQEENPRTFRESAPLKLIGQMFVSRATYIL
jgi:hypothetical protein